MHKFSYHLLGIYKKLLPGSSTVSALKYLGQGFQFEGESINNPYN
jgi:hypothetical protein